MFSFLRSKSERSPSTDMASPHISETVSGQLSGTRIAEQESTESTTVGNQDQDYRPEDELESDLNPAFTSLHADMTPPKSQDEVTPSSDQTQPICNSDAGANGQTRLRTAEPSAVMESIESDHTFSPDLRKYLPSGDVPTYHRLKRTDRSSAPPEDLGTLRNQEQFRRLNYLDRLTLDVLPPPTAPVYLQVLTYIQRFTLWCAKIEDKERWEQMTTYLGEKMEKVWMQAMRDGFIPQDWDDDAEIRARIGEEHLAAQEAQLKAQKKRPVDPRAEVVIDTKRGKNTSQNVITIGEIEEAGVSFDMVKQRVDIGDLSGGDFLMRRTLQEYGREDQLDSTDWLGGVQRTAYNPRGRDLQAYCLWEVQQSVDEMHMLERLILTFKMEVQRKNTRARIADEQRRHDLCLALALELDSKVQYDNQDDDDALDDADSTQAHIQDEDSEIEYQGRIEHPSEKVYNSQHIHSYTESTIEVHYPDTHENHPGQSLNVSPEKEALLDITGDPAMVTPPQTPAKDRLKRSITEVETEEVSITECSSSTYTDRQQETSTKRAKQVERSPRASQAGDFAEADPKEEDFPIVDDVEGYPTKADILAAMPRDGWKFADVVEYHKKDDTFAKLLRSVAYSDMEKGRWFPRTPQASAMNLDGAVPVRNGHHAYIVSMPYKSPLNPEDYTTQGIHHTRGFRWRYFPGTSIIERAEAKDHVEAYVDSIIDRDKQTAEDPKLVPSSRYGGYEQICDPADPTRKTMIHGIWDTKQSQLVPGNEWFYKGRKGEWKPRVFFYQGKTKYEGEHPNDVKAPKVSLRVTSKESTPAPRRGRADGRRDTKVGKKQVAHSYAKLPAPKFKKRTINMNNKPGAKGKAKTRTATASSSRAPRRTISMHEERKFRAPRAAATARASYTYDEDIGSDGEFDPNA